MVSFAVNLISLAVVIASSIQANATATKIAFDAAIPDVISDQQNNGSRRALKILMSISYSGMAGSGPEGTESSRLALQNLRNLPNWLPNYDIELVPIDDMCDDATAVGALMAALRQEGDFFPLVILNDCTQISQVITAEAMKPLNLVGLAQCPLNNIEYDEHKRFSNLMWLNQLPDMYYIALAKFLKQMNWNKIGVISEYDFYYNLADSYLVQHMDRHNISIVSFAKISYDVSTEESLELAYGTMKTQDPRLVAIQGFSSVTTLCWMHRFELYGPNYVIFMTGWTAIDETTEIPEQVSWCTHEMVLQVLESVVYYADGTLADQYGKNSKDSAGVTLNDVRSYLEDTIDHLEQIPFWEYYFPIYYDRVTALGIALNITETLLGNRNQTLSDWLTSSTLFQENGSEIVDILQQSFHSLNMTGLKGKYHFDQKTGMANGKVPLVFTQVQVRNASSHTVPIAYLPSTELNETIILLQTNIKWRTYNKQPPRDSVEIIDIEMPILPYALNIVVKVLAAMLVVFIAGLSFLIKPKQAQQLLVNTAEIFILCGAVLLSSSILVIPLDVLSHLEPYCTAFAMLLLVGFSLVISGIVSSLNEAVRVVVTRNAVTQTKRCICVGTLSKFLWSSPYFYLACSLIQLILFAAVLATFSIRTVTTDLGLQFTNKDHVIAYRRIRYECSVAETLFTGTKPVVIMSIVTALQFVLILRAAYMAVVVQTQARKRNVRKDFKQWAICVYCLIVVIIAGCFIALMGTDNNQYLLATACCCIICFVAVTVGFLSATKRVDTTPVNDINFGTTVTGITSLRLYQTPR